MKDKIQVIAASLYFFCAVPGLCGIFITYALNLHREVEISMSQKPLHDVISVEVDRDGSLYYALGQGASIQIFDHDGVFLYGVLLPTGGMGHYWWTVDEENRLHILVARTKKYIVLEGQTVLINEFVQGAAFDAIIDELDGEARTTFLDDAGNTYSVHGKKIIKYDAESGRSGKISPSAPWFPLPIEFYFIMVWVGGGSFIFAGLGAIIGEPRVFTLKKNRNGQGTM